MFPFSAKLASDFPIPAKPLSMKTLFYEIKPVAIKVHGEFGFADYVYSLIMQTPDGKKKMKEVPGPTSS